MSVIHKLINSVWNKEELPDQWKESVIVPIHKKGDKTDCNNYRKITLLSTSYKILSISFSQVTVHTYLKLLGAISVDIEVTQQQQPVRLSAFVRYWSKIGNTMGQYISHS
jgi:hypothetical protein